ncbi:hypothetical protein HY384_03785 [Candidatus Daviesbacteria bacterium]|nr:hypothetical protein [Candidatus Daviesbacteria bacterium]
MKDGEPLQIPEESWTVDMWREITADWNLFNIQIARILAGKTYEERRKAGGEFFETRFNRGLGPDYSEFLANLFILSDSTLATLIESLPKDKDPVVVIPGMPFKPFEESRRFLPDEGIGSEVLTRPLDFGEGLWGNIQAIKVANDAVISVVTLIARTPQDLLRVREIHLLGTFRNAHLHANFGSGDNSIEKQTGFTSQHTEDGESIIPKLVTGYTKSENQQIVVGLPYNLDALRSELTFTLKPKDK